MFVVCLAMPPDALDVTLDPTKSAAAFAVWRRTMRAKSDSTTFGHPGVSRVLLVTCRSRGRTWRRWSGRRCTAFCAMPTCCRWKRRSGRSKRWRRCRRGCRGLRPHRPRRRQTRTRHPPIRPSCVPTSRATRAARRPLRRPRMRRRRRPPRRPHRGAMTAPSPRCRRARNHHRGCCARSKCSGATDSPPTNLPAPPPQPVQRRCRTSHMGRAGQFAMLTRTRLDDRGAGTGGDHARAPRALRPPCPRRRRRCRWSRRRRRCAPRPSAWAPARRLRAAMGRLRPRRHVP